MNKCHICNNRFPETIDREIVSIYQVPKDSTDLPLISSDKFVNFCAECLWENCDSKLKHFHDRYGTECLYCGEKVNTKDRYFYLVWERSFDIINSQMIHGKCYAENIGIFEKRKERIKKNSGTIFGGWAFPGYGMPAYSPIAPSTLSADTLIIDYADVLIKSNPGAPESLIVSPKTYRAIVDELLSKDKKV